MAALVVITTESKAAAMTRWACQFAHGSNEPLSILYAVKRVQAREPRIVCPSDESDEKRDPVLTTIFQTLEEVHCRSCVDETTNDGGETGVDLPPPAPAHAKVDPLESPSDAESRSTVVRKLVYADRQSDPGRDRGAPAKPAHRRQTRQQPQGRARFPARPKPLRKRPLQHPAGAVPDRLLTGDDGMAVAVVRKAKPIGEIFRRKLERWLHFRVPQLKREDRIALFESLQVNSRWSFDFMTLICLATAIAALGLIVNSTAVVIGAMLVAPLMTPLLGAGLSLVQGNLPLMKTCARAIVYGFFAALAIGVFIGFITPIRELTTEMASRGGPTLLDMGVAFLSGVAASYCIARPRLTAALAGVAIAAALVPPIATTGIAIALGEVAVARGAAVLFGTNVVAIILGAAINFYAAGIRGGKSRTERQIWVRRTALGLIIAAVVLAIPLGSVLLTRAIEQRAKKPAMPEALLSRIEMTISKERGARLIHAKLTPNQKDYLLEIRVAAASAPEKGLADRIAASAKAILLKPSETPGSVTVRISTELVIESDPVE